MAMVCPQCSSVHEQRLHCPACGGRLLFRDGRAPRRSLGVRWQQTPWGRILIGLLLAQGLFYGARHLLAGVLLASSGPPAEQAAHAVPALLLLQGAQLLALLLGAALAGGGQRHGLVLGAVVGVWNGVLAVLLRQNPAQGLTVVALYGQPLLHAAFGAVGGWVGGRIWKPVPEAAPPAAPPRKARARRKPSPFAGRIAWLRVAAGAALAVAGSLSAGLLFDKMLDVSHGRLATTHELQDRIITWEIKALALLAGGALAGATTPNGLKQGLAVGLASSFLLIALEARPGPRWLEVAGLILVSTFSLALVGGWFGGRLFPPVVPRPRGDLGPAALS